MTERSALTIAQLDNGDRFVVKRITIARAVGKRLADMGFTRGATGVVVRCALLGDPLQVRVCGYSVSLRRSEADGIEVERHGG